VSRTIVELLARARAGLHRVSPAQAAAAAERGALLVDIRPSELRQRDGVIPGALVIDRNVLEWRLDPSSPDRTPEMTSHEIPVIVFCDEGYASSLAAATLQELGLPHATDMIGGYQAWRTAGLSVASAPVG
jgi:rhodanese-related sulfurtransferase